jgi:Flp pilus assembly protein TadD
MARLKSGKRTSPRLQPVADRAPAPTGWGWREWLLTGLLAAAVLITYGPLYHCGFILLDDPKYASTNPHVLTGLSAENFRWAWTTTDAENWHPLTWLSLQLDAQLFGPGPWGFHRTSLLLHLANTWLLFVVFRRLTGAAWRSGLVAALFSVHPLHVESVAWVAERKDVLSTSFGFLALLAYTRYVRAPGVGPYLLVTVGLALSLLAKPMLVTLPCLLLLLDYWPLGRWRIGGERGTSSPSFLRLLLEKAPLFALVAAACAVTLWAQSQAVRPLALIPLGQRLGNAVVTYSAYLVQTFVPLHLAPFYPHLGAGLGGAEIAQAAALLVGVTVLVLLRGRQCPYLPVGWFWYLGALVPVIGLVQVGDQARADRYTYVPLIGIFLMLSWGLADLARSRHWEKPAAVVAAAAVALLMWAGSIQVGYWQNDFVLWKHTVEVAPGSVVAHNSLALAMVERKDLERARLQFEEALRLSPEEPHVLGNLGVLLMRQGKYDQAAVYLRKSLDLEPNPTPQQHMNLALALTGQGNLDEAVSHYRDALRLDPGMAAAHNSLGLIYRQRREWDEAIACFRQAALREPTRLEYPLNLATTCAAAGRFPAAAEAARQALRQAAGQPALEREIRELLRFYEEGKSPPAPHNSGALKGQGEARSSNRHLFGETRHGLTVSRAQRPSHAWRKKRTQLPYRMPVTASSS